MSILLHTCCGPCLAHNINRFKDYGNVIPFWFNPNIHPYREYKKRLESFKSITLSEKVIIDDTYDLDMFFEAVECGDNRCYGCYEMRLKKTAEVARKHELEKFSTTMLSSPHQDHELIVQIGEELSSKYDVEFLYLDLRKDYYKSKNEARKLGLYLQSYCGCIWSEEERYVKDKK